MSPGAFALVLALVAPPAPAASAAPPAVVRSVDLARYMGSWYEIAHIPNFPQRGCTDTVVHYRLAPGGGFELLNTCWKGGAYKPYHGWAKPWEKGATAKFHAKFFVFFGGDYWIIDLDPNYQWAAVADSQRTQLWVISRTQKLDDKIYAGILERARAQGYDVTKLERTILTGKKSAGFQ
ncbi:MAG: lipocalin family protein [Elusimicrobia bacterium]|nr:lipocalin family protein [Elusimicrobiota bacterium]